MRRYTRCVTALLLAVSLLFIAGKANASHIFGADFYYTWVSGNTYTINLAVYADCSGAAFPNLNGATPSVEVYKNTSQLFTTMTLTQSGTSVEVTPVCNAQINNTTCNGGTVPGVKRFIYTGSVTLNGPSSNWRFRFTGAMGGLNSAGRSNSITNIIVPGTGSVTALEATLNNMSGNNSSAVYTTIPTPFFCINKPQQYNPGAVDPNTDSLGFSMVPGLEGGGGTVAYLAPYTAAAPLATAAGTFTFSNTTGQLNFTPNAVQRSLVVGKVEEYRNGTLVGTSMREMTFVVLNNCNNNPPDGAISNPTGGTVVNGTTIRVCQNQGLLGFSINPTDSDGDTINVSVAGLPAGATFTVTGNNTIAPTGTFSWNVTGVAPGSYTFFITYTDQGCPLSSKQTIAYTVNVVPQPSIAFQLLSAATCTKKAVFTVTPGNATAPYVFNIVQGSVIIHSFPGLTSAQTDSLSPGTYTFTIKDANNCQRDTVITIQQPPLPSATIVLTLPMCQGGSNGSIAATGTGGAAPYQYALGSGTYGASGSFTGLAPGSYTLHIRDANLCVKDTTVILPDAPPITAVLNLVKPPCNAFQSGVISVDALNGTAPYQYALGSGAFSNSNTFSGLGSGSYVVHIRDANNCTKDTTVVLPDSIRVQATIPVTHVLCNGQSTGSVTLNASGTTAPYTYALGSGAFGSVNTFTGLAAGTHVFHIKDPDDCYLDTSVTINQPTALALSPTHTDVHCFGGSNGSITIAATGATPAYLYSLNGAVPAPANTFMGLSAGTYTITVTDASNCSKNTQVVVAQPADIVLSVSLTHVSCAGGSNGSAILTANGGTAPYTYALDGGAYSITNTFSGLAAGSYTLHAKDSRGCIRDSIISITVPTPIVPAAGVKRSTCSALNNGSVTLSATGGTPGYTYARGTGVYGSSPVFAPLSAGTYTFHIRDTLGCIKDTVIAIVDSVFVSSQVTVTAAGCFGDSTGVITATGSNGLSPYQYALGSGSYQASGSFVNKPAGVYVVHVKDANGCIKDTSITVGQPPVIVPQAALTRPLCFGGSNGSISIAATGGTPGYTYALGSGAYGAGTVFNGLAAGTYVLHVKDANNCIKDTTVILGQPAELKISSVTVSDVICFGESNGTVAVLAAGGTPAYGYAVDAGTFQPSNMLAGIAAGSRIIHVRDANGCTKDTTVIMQQPDKLFFGPATVTTPTCEGNTDGAVVLTGSGGVMPYAFAKNGGGFSGTSNFPNLQAGSYTFHIRDANGCLHDTTIELKGFPRIVISEPDIRTVRCHGEQNGRITLQVSGGTPPLSYQRTLPLPAGSVVTTPDFDNLPGGQYTFVITDSKGCKKDTVFTVGQPGKLALKPTVGLNGCEGLDAEGTVKVEVSGGTPDYSYLWNTNPPQTVPEVRGLPNGDYRVWVTDANGCRDSALLQIVYNNCCKPFIPDAFTPNGDGRNDLFRLRYKGDMVLQYLHVYNRFGQRIFTATKGEDGWDGTFMGVPQDMGTYYYQVRIVCGNQGTRTVEFKGNVTLIR